MLILDVLKVNDSYLLLCGCAPASALVEYHHAQGRLMQPNFQGEGSHQYTGDH